MIRGTFKLVKNTKQWDKMKRRLLTKSPRVVDVGWWGDKYDNGLPVAWIAMLNEYGYMTSGKYQGYHPPRPFFRVFLKDFINNSVLVSDKIAPAINKVAMGKMTWAAMHREIGQQLVDWVKKKIIETNTPSNSPLTISLKGFNDPLINTGRMYDTVRFRLRQSRK